MQTIIGKYKYIIGFVLSVSALWFVYKDHFNNGFYFDDHHTIVENAYLRNLGNIPLFFKDAKTYSTTTTNRAYRPLTTTLNSVDVVMGLNRDGAVSSFYFHLHIFIFYVLQCLLLFIFCRKLLERIMGESTLQYRDWVALAITLLYGFHTANAETINYITARTDAFTTTGTIASLVLFQIKWTRKWFLYLLPTLVGLYAKQTAAMFAPILLIYIVLFHKQQSTRWKLQHITTSFVLIFGLFIINQIVLTPKSTDSTNTGVDAMSYFLTQQHVIVHYLKNFVLPINLSVDPGMKIIENPLDSRIIIGLVFNALLFFTAVVLWIKKRAILIAFGIFWFYIALAPTSSFIPLFQVSNDHRTFFPYVGLCLVIGGMLLEFYKSKYSQNKTMRWAIVIIVLLIVAAFGQGVRQRTQLWGDKIALWKDAVDKNPENGRALMNYGVGLMGKGQYQKALENFEKAKEFLPAWTYVYINLAIIHNELGHKEKAEENYKLAIYYGATESISHYYYAQWLADNERFSEADQLLKKAESLSPGSIKIQALRKRLNAQLNEQNSNIQEYQNQIETTQSAEQLINISLKLFYLGDYKGVIKACKKAIKINPNYPEAYNNICTAYNQLKQYKKAIEACDKALELKPDFERALNNKKIAAEGLVE